MQKNTYNERLKEALNHALQSYASKTPEQRRIQSDKQFAQWRKIKYGSLTKKHLH